MVAFQVVLNLKDAGMVRAASRVSDHGHGDLF